VRSPGRSPGINRPDRQYPNAPLAYLSTEELAAFRPGRLTIDVSVEEGMVFSRAIPTPFAVSMTVGTTATYYAVDHSPSLLWKSTSWELSEPLIPFLRRVKEEPESSASSETRPSNQRDRGRAHQQRGNPDVPRAVGGVPVRHSATSPVSSSASRSDARALA